ncbi:MAG: hypothetical protein ACFFC3_03455, partial [Candidatus Odinarchaeota archaeon]
DRSLSNTDDKFNFIRRETIENHLAFFDNKSSKKDSEIIHFLSRDKCKQLVEYLTKNEDGCFLTKLSTDLGMHFNTIKKYMNKLEEFNLVSNRDAKQYFLNRENLEKIN